MSFLASLFAPRRESAETPTENKVADASNLTWTTLLGSQGSSKTGLAVSESTALRVAVVYACCRVLAEDVGKVPVKVMRELSNGKGSEVARRHPVHKIISRRPNEWQTSMEWRMTMMLHALLGQGGYSYINRGSDGVPAELIPMFPGSVCVKQDPDWTIWYEWSSGDGKRLRLRRQDVHAIHGLSWDGLRAMPVVQQAKEAIGLAMATEETQARLHGQGARPGGIVTTTSKLSPEEVTNIKQTFAAGYTGVDNAFKTLLLDNGLEFKPWAQSGVDGQHLENRKYQVEDVCRFFRVFPSMIGFSDKTSTYASAEAFFGAHVGHSLMPWFSLWEQAMDRDLLTEQEVDDGLYTKFFVDGLLRGSADQRAAYYQSGITNGWMTRNEVRVLEDRNPLPGLDEIITPMNMGGTPAPKPGAEPTKKTTTAPADEPDEDDVEDDA